MKSRKSEIRDLMNESKQKQEILVVTSEKKGIYEFLGEQYNEAEFENLKAGYERTVIFVPKKE